MMISRHAHAYYIQYSNRIIIYYYLAVDQNYFTKAIIHYIINRHLYNIYNIDNCSCIVSLLSCQRLIYGGGLPLSLGLKTSFSPRYEFHYKLKYTI